ncbi:MAG: hypothetical protein ACRC7N_21365 [Clostridium sp.]
MKLNDLMTNKLNELLEQTNVVSVKPISDKYGNIEKIIVEYVPHEGSK